MKNLLPISAALAVAAASPAQGGDRDMAQVVDGFYRVYESFRPPDGVPDATVRKRFEPYISQSLARLLADVDDTQHRYEKLTEGRFPPLIAGDPFTPNFDGATSYAVGTCAADAAGGHCSVALSFTGGRDKPRSWTDTVALVRTEAGWKVNDIVYGGDWDAGVGGSLSETLRSAIEHGDDMKAQSQDRSGDKKE